MIIPIRPFLLDVLLHALHQPACARRDPGGKPSGTRVYYPSLRFSQSTLDDSGRNQGGPLPTLQAACHQLAPTQGCQELSCTECERHVAAATHSLWCHSYHDAHRHQPKGTAVLWKWYCQGVRQHSQVSLRYLGPCRGHGTIN